MKIRIEHQYLGAALMQIAEHPQFTAINPLGIKTSLINNAFLINNDIALFLKYASEPNTRSEYTFAFNADQISNIQKAHKKYAKLFLGLVCVEDQEICCVTYDQFAAMVETRKNLAAQKEDSYQVLVTAKQGGRLRVYLNAPGTKGKTAGNAAIIPRNAFPMTLFV